ncbi:hypothetical protein BV22DRAFT_1112632 [Leucogyrophana mollusca]|uniref:Uncharacterized protein n=1 Tax=Leucogyrophana mollusca TaxID=85980 RepID=A0ACB8BGE6_9AGAM|nr:hypothetical protein BV22DRAFT_1112632 [Leucogyrophana mollusca]
MGKVTTFCILSGCTPEIPSTLPHIFEYSPSQLQPGPLVLEALRVILDEDERRGQEDITVIGAIHADGEPFSDDPDGFGEDEVEAVADSDIRSISHCTMGETWDMGDVESRYTGQSYRISYGCCMMVQSASLAIMPLATNGRLTPQRLWRLAMRQGLGFPTDSYGLYDVDYGEVDKEREQFPACIPGLSDEYVIALEALGDLDAIQRTIIHDGKFWIWMTPDRFPLEPTSHDIPLSLITLASAKAISKIELLPLELLTHLSVCTTLPALFALASASQTLRTRILGCDAIARSWIQMNAPWYIPVPSSVHELDQTYTTKNKQARWDVWGESEMAVNMNWAYLRRCLNSGSMRNRGRIWKVIQNIERVADQAGV